jgi:hypothetical protein
LGLKSSSRKDRRRKIKAFAPPSPTRSVTLSRANDDVAVASSSIALFGVVDPMEYIRRNPNHLAVIAVGYGPGLAPDILAAAVRRRRQRLLLGTLVFGFAAMGGSLYFQGSQQCVFGTAATGEFLGGFWSSSGQPTVQEHSFFSGSDSDDTPAESVAMNKAASIILPRINVLQKTLPSRSRVDSSSLQLQSGISKLDMGESASHLRKNVDTLISRSLTSRDESSSATVIRDDVFLSSFAFQRKKIVRFARVASHMVSRVIVKMILEPMTFIWRALRKGAPL